MTRFRYGVAALAALALLTAGCGGPYEQADSAGSSGGTAAGAAAPEKPEAAASAASAADAGGRQADAQVTIAPAQRSVVYTAEMSIRAKDVAAASDRAKAIVTGAGGYVSEERSSAFDGGDQAVITFKIPPERYSDVLAQLGRDLGKRVSVHQGAQDVTQEVADVDSRVKSAQATLDQFRTLLSKATKIGEIMEIEREISSREADLESLQARQKALAAQTGMATLTLTLLAEPKPSARPSEPPSGFLAGLRSGWRALTTSTQIALTVFGALLPWLVLIAVVWVVTLVLWRRLRRTSPFAPPQPPGHPGGRQGPPPPPGHPAGWQGPPPPPVPVGAPAGRGGPDSPEEPPPAA
ncbi:hypothetical protein GCM10009530_20590 [Microbispora corallina]|uniref:DUF4349 domain-containing protein n=2 Tax=Microbispora corallina TaxID=83302 RepID=A0ABQ4FTX9_9ACTN|nr:hypothetical protein Mco01_12810 [Microbispora corallina]